MTKPFTVSFCGTACARDEGERDRSWDYKLIDKQHVVSDKKIYDRDTGYIPVRLHLDISKNLENTQTSATVRGVGENDWAGQVHAGLLKKNLLPNVSEGLKAYTASYSKEGDQRNLTSQVLGWSATALALHGANLAVAAAQEGATVVNLLGHSRGAVSAIMAAWFIYAYGGQYRQLPINIFAIDPVPGTGQWYGILTQLPPNVRNYVGVYAWDHLDAGFTPLVPRPNYWMTQQKEHHKTEAQPLGGTWDTLADRCQLDDPLAPPRTRGLEQPQGYHLYACRGRHGTVAGNSTRNGLYDPTQVSESVASVPRLVYKVARAYLTQWDTVFQTRCRVRENANALRRKIHSAHMDFDAMASSETRTSRLVGRRFVRRISSIPGMLTTDTYYMEDVVGEPPLRMAYPCTTERRGRGWVTWKFL